MKLDKDEHRQFLLELMQQVSYPGKLLDLAYEVKAAIAAAEIESLGSTRLDFDVAADARDLPSGAALAP